MDGYAFIEAGEAWLDAVHIPEYTVAPGPTIRPRRKRKLLLHKAQILKIENKVNSRAGTRSSRSRSTSTRGRAKVEIAVAKGKREYDKRQALRERQDQREAAARDGDSPQPRRLAPGIESAAVVFYTQRPHRLGCI